MQIRSLLSIASLLFLLISMPLQAAVDCMADQEKTLPEVMQCLSNQIQQLAGENKRLQTDVVNLQSNVQKITSENQNLQTEVANLRRENKRLQNDVTKLTDAVQVAKNGNVGIGTTTPGAKLDVNGDLLLTNNSYNRLRVTDTDDDAQIEFVKASNGKKAGAIQFNGWGAQDLYETDGLFFSSRTNNSNSYIYDMVLTEQGNVGIGTTNPEVKLDIKGNAPKLRIWGQRGDDKATLQLREHNNAYGFDLFYNGLSDNNFYIEAFNGGHSMGKHLTIARQTGNVGIGTTKPQYKLDVKGTIRGQNVSPSDQRLKRNIHAISNALAKVTQLHGVSFNWKDNSQNQTTQIGLIAQEVEPIFPELVSTDNEGYKSIAYGKLTVILIEAIKDLQRQVAALKAQ